MESFTVQLSNKATLTGIRNIPSRSSLLLRYRPLIVGVHGGTYESHYFDADDKHTASRASNSFEIPFISIDRPGYGGTDSLFPIPEASSYPNEEGRWLHEYILPAFWSEYGATNDCNCIVILGHSLGVMAVIVAAAKHAQDERPSYPLGGIVVSGLGDQLLASMKESPISKPNHPPEHVFFPPEVKDSLMFRPGTVDPDILKQTERLNVPGPFAELQSLRDLWVPTWRETWASRITKPVMFGLAEQDCFFEATRRPSQGLSSSIYKQFPCTWRRDQIRTALYRAELLVARVVC